MPKSNLELITVDHIKELARRLAAVAEVLESSASRLENADLTKIEAGISTVTKRIREVEGFGRTIARKSQEKIDAVRVDAIKFQSRSNSNKQD